MIPVILGITVKNDEVPLTREELFERLSSAYDFYAQPYMPCISEELDISEIIKLGFKDDFLLNEVYICLVEQRVADYFLVDLIRGEFLWENQEQIR